MSVIHHELTLKTNGHGDTLDLSDEPAAWLADGGAREGTVTAFAFIGERRDSGCHTSS